MNEPRFRLEGDEYIYAFDEDGLAIKFSQLRLVSASGAIRGFCEVYSIRPDQPPGSVWWNQVNLVTQADRNRTMDKLRRVAPRGGEAKAWEYEVDWVYQDCAKRLLSVPEPVDLLDGEDEQELEHLFDPIALLNQVNMFVADQGSTKSYLLLYLAVCVASGRVSIFGKPRVTGNVVLFDWEVDRALQRRRVGWICRGLKMPEPRGIFYENMSDRPGNMIDQERNMKLQLARTGAVLAIIDSLTFGAGGDLNATELSAPTMKLIGSLGQDVTKLITAHPSKASRRRTTDSEDANAPNPDLSAIGSALWEFRPRSIWTMKAPPRHNRGSSFVVTMRDRKQSEDRDGGELFYRLNFDQSARSASFVIADAMDHAVQQDTSVYATDRILRFLLEHHQANTPQLAKFLNVKPNQVRVYTGRLVERSQIIKIGGDEETGTAVWALAGSSTLKPVEETRALGL
jgi:hypothetical protein